MAKRPLGLAKSAKLKKQKSEKEADTTKEPESKQEADLNIDLDEDVEDESLAEIYGLFKTFDTSAKTNPKMAMGLVHECDSLLRERKKLPARFHMCYGLALVTIAGFQDDSEEVTEGETPEAFLDAAIDRFDVGLEEDAADPGVKAAKATALIAKLDERLRTTKSKKSKAVAANIELLNSAKELAAGANGSPFRQAEAVSAIQQFAVSLEAMPKFAAKSKELLDWCGQVWPSIAESDDKRAQMLAWQGIGELALAEGQSALAEIVGDDDDEDESDGAEEGNSDGESDDEEIDVNTPAAEHVRKTLTKAIEYLSKVESDEKPSVYVQIAEAKISMGNVTANETPEQAKMYDQAVRLLKKAQRLGAGDYQQLIESLEDE